MDPDDFVEAIEASREIVSSGKYDTCPCEQSMCEWHGKCRECVMIHRVKGKHLPECLQPIIKDHAAELARAIEMKLCTSAPARSVGNI